MKKIVAILSVFAVVLFASGALASPFYLTLTGNVKSVFDVGGLTDSSGINVGDELSYVLKVDRDVTGSITRNGRTTNMFGSYYASLISGNLKGQTGQGIFSTKNFVYENKLLSSLHAGNEFSNVHGTNFLDDFNGYNVGSSFDSFIETTYGNGIKMASLNLKNVRVTAKSNTAPTPVPAGFLLMGAGLGAVGFVRRKIRG